MDNWEDDDDDDDDDVRCECRWWLLVILSHWDVGVGMHIGLAGVKEDENDEVDNQA